MKQFNVRMKKKCIHGYPNIVLIHLYVTYRYNFNPSFICMNPHLIVYVFLRLVYIDFFLNICFKGIPQL